MTPEVVFLTFASDPANRSTALDLNGRPRRVPFGTDAAVRPPQTSVMELPSNHERLEAQFAAIERMQKELHRLITEVAETARATAVRPAPMRARRKR
jgi:hypothetical protein